MAMPAWVPEAWAELSVDQQRQAGDFIQFLLSQQKKEEQNNPKPFRFGTMKGQIEIFDNFDDPLPGFEEYM